MNLLDWLAEPLGHGFMLRATLAIAIVGVVCGVIGVFVTLRGLAFMGDALAHAIFPGVVIAFVLGGNFLVGALVAATLVSLGIGAIGQSGRLSNDTAIGVLFAGAFALGVAIISTQETFARDVTGFLFGSILGVGRDDLVLSAAIGLGVLLVMVLFRRELVTVAFDRTFAASVGMRLWAWDQLFLLLLSLSIVVSLQTVGNILVLAMLVTPAATARLLTDRLPVTLGLAALIGAFSGITGLYLSYYASFASGASVVLVATTVFAVALLVSPKAGIVTTRLVRRLHHGHPERDRFGDRIDEGLGRLPASAVTPTLDSGRDVR
ncbi:MAG TPA: metal ABC transporter permease [Thermomicrobiales bacterium]|nr:metal ABC transporter permease [Thermomicrobiales bacterium]